MSLVFCWLKADRQHEFPNSWIHSATEKFLFPIFVSTLGRKCRWELHHALHILSVFCYTLCYFCNIFVCNVFPLVAYMQRARIARRWIDVSNSLRRNWRVRRDMCQVKCLFVFSQSLARLCAAPQKVHRKCSGATESCHQVAAWEAPNKLVSNQQEHMHAQTNNTRMCMSMHTHTVTSSLLECTAKMTFH